MMGEDHIELSEQYHATDTRQIPEGSKLERLLQKMSRPQTAFWGIDEQRGKDLADAIYENYPSLIEAVEESRIKDIFKEKYKEELNNGNLEVMEVLAILAAERLNRNSREIRERWRSQKVRSGRERDRMEVFNLAAREKSLLFLALGAKQYFKVHEGYLSRAEQVIKDGNWGLIVGGNISDMSSYGHLRKSSSEGGKVLPGERVIIHPLRFSGADNFKS